MKAELFAELIASAQEYTEILSGRAEPSRTETVSPDDVRQIRGQTRLSQAKFAELLHVDVATLRNWEQGRRTPTGPAQALLRAVSRDPEHVLRALAG